MNYLLNSMTVFIVTINVKFMSRFMFNPLYYIICKLQIKIIYYNILLCYVTCKIYDSLIINII